MSQRSSSGKRGVARQIDLQGRDRGISVGDGVKIRARARVLAGAGVPTQYTSRPRGSFAVDDRFCCGAGRRGVVALTPRTHRSGRSGTLTFRITGSLQRIAGHALDQLSGDLRGAREIAGAAGLTHRETAIAGNPRKRPSTAAATVPPIECMVA